MHVEVHEYTLKLGTGVCEKNNHPDKAYAHLITHLHFWIHRYEAPFPLRCKVGQLILASPLAVPYPVQLCIEGGRGVLMLRNFVVAATGLDM